MGSTTAYFGSGPGLLRLPGRRRANWNYGCRITSDAMNGINTLANEPDRTGIKLQVVKQHIRQTEIYLIAQTLGG
jgi:hypothetical protein